MKKLISLSFLLRFGLACVFLTNSLTAFFAPDEFNDLISGSFLAKILPVSVGALIIFIGVNDLIMTILLLSGWKTSKVAIWAMIWIIGVIFIIGVISLDALEHLAFLSLALAIYINERKIRT